MEYLLILFLFFISGLAIEWKFKIHLYHTRRERIFMTLLFFVVGIAWDSFAVWRQHWAFLGHGLSGLYVGNLPIEEYVFSLVIPFWIITIYKLLDKKIR
jgi:lycopene cyclase domain-containing protein